MKIKPETFAAPAGETLDLDRRPTRVDPFYDSKKDYRKTLADHVERLRRAQELLYADATWAVLVIFQGMDAAGKDGAIAHVMSGVNPQGCEVHSFKRPSAEELRHDFLWRTTARLPERGRIGIFNRSYYEEVVVVRVHPELLDRQGLPSAVRGDEAVWSERYRSIVEHEAHLARSGTRILKFFLHMSPEEQRRRLLARVDDPTKNWKLTRSDVTERALWPQYQRAYAEALSATSTAVAPWYVVPADDKPNARLIISQILVEGLEAMGLGYPRADAAQREELRTIRGLLT